MPISRKTEATPKAYSLTKIEVQSSNQTENNVEVVGDKDEKETTYQTLPSIWFRQILIRITSLYQTLQIRIF